MPSLRSMIRTSLALVLVVWVARPESSKGMAGVPSTPFEDSGRATQPTQRPNFLFIYTDDQRWDAMSVVQREEGERARFPWFQTPHMDQLAADGVRFRNAFVTNSLCSPSRASFLTGQYSHTNGVIDN